MQGHRDEVLEIIINPDALNAYQIAVEELLVILQRNNRLIPAGTMDLESGRFAVKVPAVFERAEEVLELPIRSTTDSVVTLKDVARVSRTFKDRTSYARYNGQEAISISVTKRSDANVIDAVEAVMGIVGEAESDIPPSYYSHYVAESGGVCSTSGSRARGQYPHRAGARNDIGRCLYGVSKRPGSRARHSVLAAFLRHGDLSVGLHLQLYGDVRNAARTRNAD